jgi:hypothetical protein
MSMLAGQEPSVCQMRLAIFSSAGLSDFRCDSPRGGEDENMHFGLSVDISSSQSMDGLSWPVF